MANQEQLDRLLKQGVQAWNEWRVENPGVVIDLSRVDLSLDVLYDADLSDPNLRVADLSFADFSDANLRGAGLSRADLIYANLRGANLREAGLSYANLSGADLRTTVALVLGDRPLKPVWEQNWFVRSARRSVGLQRGRHVFQASNRQMRGLTQPVGVVLPMDASIGHPTGSPFVPRGTQASLLS